MKSFQKYFVILFTDSEIIVIFAIPKYNKYMKPNFKNVVVIKLSIGSEYDIPHLDEAGNKCPFEMNAQIFPSYSAAEQFIAESIKEERAENKSLVSDPNEFNETVRQLFDMNRQFANSGAGKKELRFEADYYDSSEENPDESMYDCSMMSDYIVLTDVDTAAPTLSELDINNFDFS